MTLPSVSAQYFCPCFSFREEQCLSTGCGLYRFFSSLLGIFMNGIPFGSWETLISLASVIFYWLPPVPHPPLLDISTKFPEFLYFSPISSHIRSCLPFVSFSLLFPPSSVVQDIILGLLTSALVVDHADLELTKILLPLPPECWE